MVQVKKMSKNLILATSLFLILLNTEPSYCEELDQNDLQYQFQVLPMIVAAENHYNDISTLINEFIEYQDLDLAIDLCKQSGNSYKTIGTIGKNIVSVKPGRVYRRYSQMLSELFLVREAILLFLIQSCASDPFFEKPNVWNSFKIRSLQLERQISDISSRLEEELNNIEKSFQNEQ